eukprot:CAMPEP_0173213850 /NCGR_PEP_ID=MMETSP1141-20130122/25629_1 /TAXON_ID=483371 /ORGANISM="non described non described, Strain CCMP2298" /LENGTH=42 /DNA_ID= /DNA_START= /DNA_END= /DNA_ORIENTATION=
MDNAAVGVEAWGGVEAWDPVTSGVLGGTSTSLTSSGLRIEAL